MVSAALVVASFAAVEVDFSDLMVSLRVDSILVFVERALQRLRGLDGSLLMEIMRRLMDAMMLQVGLDFYFMRNFFKNCKKS